MDNTLKIMKTFFSRHPHGECGIWDSVSARRATINLLEKQGGVVTYIKILDLAEQMSRYDPDSRWKPTINPYDEYEKLPNNAYMDERRIVFHRLYSLYCEKITSKLKDKNALRRELSQA